MVDGSTRLAIALLTSCLLIVPLMAAAQGTPPASDSALAGVSETQDLHVQAPSTGDTRRPTRSTGALAAEGADRRKSAGADTLGRATTARQLTTRQKRLFVLGLWAAEKN